MNGTYYSYNRNKYRKNKPPISKFGGKPNWLLEFYKLSEKSITSQSLITN